MKEKPDSYRRNIRKRPKIHKQGYSEDSILTESLILGDMSIKNVTL